MQRFPILESRRNLDNVERKMNYVKKQKRKVKEMIKEEKRKSSEENEQFPHT